MPPARRPSWSPRLCVAPVVIVARLTNLWAAVLLIGLAAAAHQGFSANLYTIVSDTVPRKAISSVVGIGGMAAGLGMLVLSTLVGRILDWTQAAYGTEGLPDPLRDRRLGVPRRHGRHSPAVASPRTDGARQTSRRLIGKLSNGMLYLANPANNPLNRSGCSDR